MADTAPVAPHPSLLTAQFAIALIGMAIVAFTVVAVLLYGDPQTKSQTIGAVMALGSAIAGFYFGSSKGSQDKDARGGS
jgi:glucose uptake protein GlcU